MKYMIHITCRTTMLLVAFMLAITQHALAEESDLSAENIKALVAKPHSPKLTVDELKFHAAVRKYTVSGHTTRADGEKHVWGPITADEKWVDGKYIVTEVFIPNAEPMIVVVTYDSEALVYRRWVLTVSGDVIPSIGTRDGDSRTLSWSASATIKGTAYQSVSQETHGDKKTTWTEVFFSDGKLVHRQVGEAKEASE